MKKISKDKAAYMAGFFDGEGCIVGCIHNIKGRNHIYCHLSIGQKSSEVLYWLRDVLEYGRIYKRVRKDGQEICRWIVSRKLQIEHFIRTILPYSIVKKEQLEVGLELTNLVGSWGGQFRVSKVNKFKRRERAKKLKKLKRYNPAEAIKETVGNDRIKKVSKRNVPYIAGFFDGEGCIHASYSKRSISPHLRFCLHLSMSQKFPEVIYWLRNTLGYGRVRKIVRKDGREIYQWNENRKLQVEHFIKTILSYSIVKKEQLKVGLELVKLIGPDRQFRPSSANKSKRRKWYKKLKELKHAHI